ncbi:MAG: hypothetical protein IJV87_10300 [Clostridia bacterium]|nr:hypothetical protein [Clostridia bacterium]
MKKLIALLLALVMVFALAACDSGDDPNNDDPLNRDPGTSQNGGENNNGTQGGTQGGATSGDVGSMISGIGSSTALYSDMDAASKQAFIAEGARQGLDISFGADGSTTIVDTTDGTTLIQKPDGNWVFSDGQGGEGQIGGNWPDNEYTKLVPKPSFELYAAVIEDETFSVMFTNATIEQIKAYAEQVKAAGFNLNEEVTDENVMGMVIYSFAAENADGYSVEVFSASGTTGLRISK